MLDGERVKALVQSAEREVLLCAPFVKSYVLKILFEHVPASVPTKIVTRWRAEEIASGVSDLQVFDLVNQRSRTTLMLHDTLHAKLYLADDACLIGSANLTGAALGWSKHPNLEILLKADRSDLHVGKLLESLQEAVPATLAIKEEIARKVDQLQSTPRLAEEAPSEDDLSRYSRSWMPRCAAPDRLYTIYSKATTNSVAYGTLTDGLADLVDLAIPSNLSHKDFRKKVADVLSDIPSIRNIIDRIPGKLSDDEGIKFIVDLCPDLDGSSAQKQWLIIRDWITEFFDDQYEVAATNFELRLKK